MADPSFRPAGRVIRASDMTAWREGEGFIAAARAEAARIVAEAHAERERLIEEGRKEGERAGNAAITHRVADAAKRIDALLVRSEDWLASLVLETVESILGGEQRNEFMRSAATNALRQFRHARRLSVKVHPGALESFENSLAKDLDPAMRALVITQPDPQLSPGRCVVASEFGIVEAGLDEQLAALRAGLAEQIAGDDGNQ